MVLYPGAFVCAFVLDEKDIGGAAPPTQGSRYFPILQIESTYSCKVPGKGENPNWIKYLSHTIIQIDEVVFSVSSHRIVYVV